MTALASLASSTIGKKAIMAVTGIVMFLWLTIHMAGNLLVFAGQKHFNDYAHFIQSGFGVEPALLWVMRLVMLGTIAAHVWAAIGLTRRNLGARAVRYAGGRKDRRTKYVAHFMAGGGFVLLLYLVFHLLHLTVGVVPLGEGVAFAKENAYRNLVVGVGNPLVGGFYVLANVALFAHLWHGVESAFQTLGLDHPKWNAYKQGLGLGFPVLIAGGNIVIACAIMAGLVAAPV